MTADEEVLGMQLLRFALISIGVGLMGGASTAPGLAGEGEARTGVKPLLGVRALTANQLFPTKVSFFDSHARPVGPQMTAESYEGISVQPLLGLRTHLESLDLSLGVLFDSASGDLEVNYQGPNGGSFLTGDQTYTEVGWFVDGGTRIWKDLILGARSSVSYLNAQAYLLYEGPGPGGAKRYKEALAASGTRVTHMIRLGWLRGPAFLGFEIGYSELSAGLGNELQLSHTGELDPRPERVNLEDWSGFAFGFVVETCLELGGKD
jgi:hypothetical protein